MNLSRSSWRTIFDDIAYQCDCGRYPHPLTETSGLQPSLGKAYCEITPACNNHCVTCGNVFAEPAEGRQPPECAAILSPDEWALIFHKLAPPVRRIVITGGEPTLHPGFFEILDALESCPVKFTIFTNAMWDDPDAVIDNLRGRKQLTGLLVSVHGDDAATHEAFTRTPGSYLKTLQNIRRAVSAGIPLNISSVIHRYNCDRIANVHALAGRAGAKGICFNRLLGTKHTSINPSSDQVSDALRRIESLNTDEIPVRTGATLPHCFSSSFSGPCGAGASFVTIDPWGNVRPCNHSPLIAGNILSDRIESILDSEVLRHWRGFVPEPCRGCASFSLCGGGCRAEAFLSENRKDPLASSLYLHQPRPERHGNLSAPLHP